MLQESSLRAPRAGMPPHVGLYKKSCTRQTFVSDFPRQVFGYDLPPAISAQARRGKLPVCSQGRRAVKPMSRGRRSALRQLGWCVLIPLYACSLAVVVGWLKSPASLRAFAMLLTLVVIFVLVRLTPALLAYWVRLREPPPGHCSCGYDLTGNLSGICPECGKPIA